MSTDESGGGQDDITGLNGHELDLTNDAFGRLVLVTPDGRRHVGVEPVRAFPISDPTRWISFCDAHGREILTLPALDELSPGARRLVEDELALREFVPAILRIDRVTGEGAPSQWEVETDRGPTEFSLDNEDDVRRISAHRVLITDSRKLRYQILDARSLDQHSRRILERFL